MSHALLLATSSLPPSQRRSLALAGLAAVALHAALLLGWPRLDALVRAGSADGTFTTRVIAPSPAAPAAEPAPPQTAPPVQPRAKQPAPKPKPRPQPTTPRPAATDGTSASTTDTAPLQPAALGKAGGSDSPLASLLEPVPMADFGGTRPDVPLQPSLAGEAASQALAQAQAGAAPAQTAVLPRGATLNYRVSGQLGDQAVNETATLAWRRASTYYEADWDSTSAARANVRLASAGLLTEQGQLLPVLGGGRTGGAVPARFDYAQRRVLFSQPEASAELPPGAQDALSAIIQLGAWLAGDRSRFVPGQSLTLPVAEAGHVQPWRWLIEPDTSVTALNAQDMPAVKLTHIPLGDTATGRPRMEVWFAPALDHLPARLRLSWANGDVLDQVVNAARLNRAPTEARPPAAASPP